MTLQLFVWVGHGEVQENRIHYKSFTLNEQTYHVGDCVYLFPEDEQYPPYIARILAAFVDRDVQTGADPHCIEVKWYERRVNLEPSTKGIEESEREVFELEDTDVNPIGCISGKCRIVKAANYEEAYSRCGNTPGWFFCRGFFHQSSNSFMAYTPAEMAVSEPYILGAPGLQLPGPDGQATAAGQPYPDPHLQHQGRGSGAAGSNPQSGSDGSGRGPLHGAAAAVPLEGMLPPGFANGAGGGGSPYDVEEDELDEQLYHHHHQLHYQYYPQQQQPQPNRRQAHNPPPAPQQPASKRQKATGRTCVECGATSTPQWREGPMGPKTLCNACGVRYVRSLQRAAGQKRTGGGPRNGQGRSQELATSRAQQQADRVTKRGTQAKVYQNGQPTNAEYSLD